MGKRGRKNKKTLIALYEMAHGICHLCLEFVELRLATKDHIIPVWMGGSNAWSNLALAHGSCNHKRGGMTVEQFRFVWANRYYKGGNWHWPKQLANAILAEITKETMNV